MTNWARSGGDLWNDGNDIAGWTSSMISAANSNGRVEGQVLFNEGYLPRTVPATAITVQVQGTGAVCGNAMIDSGEACDDGNTISGDGCSSTCQLEGTGGSVDLRIKQWYPQGRNYVFICDESGYAANSYRWNFGDGHMQTTISDNVYHTYAGPGQRTVECTATGGGISRSDTLQITVQ